MLFLFILLLDRKMIWQTLAVCSISFLAFNFILTQENRQVVQAAGEPKSVQDQNNSNHDSASNKAALPAASDQKKAVADKNSSPKLDFSIENSPSYGPSEADVVIVEFSDYMCPACRSLHPTTRLMREFFKDKVKWVFKDFPLQQHEGADQLAEAARCAWEQNKFWEFQDELFNLDQPVDFSLIPAIAQELGLDMPQFIECVESRKYMFEVIQDKQEALQNNINSTPSVFLNGHKIEKVRTREEFKQIIEKELANQMG
jgi:protein-disulfide isomerase